MCAHWYPEGYVLPTSTAYPPGPYHPAYAQSLSSRSDGPALWYAAGTGTPNAAASNLSVYSSANLSPEQLAHIAGVTDPGLVSGVDYFKIGDTVRVRRLAAANTYSEWTYGQVVRPHLQQYRTSEPERVYYISYIDPRSGERKESKFSCYRKEIAPLFDKQGNQPLVFALVPLITPKGVSATWIPAYVVDMNNPGVKIRMTSGHIQIGSIESIVPYNGSVAGSLKSAGHRVLWNGDKGDGNNH